MGLNFLEPKFLERKMAKQLLRYFHRGVSIGVKVFFFFSEVQTGLESS